MFLRFKDRWKDGKQHRYWSVVENTRVAGGRVVQRHMLYLGEINDTQELAWQRSSGNSDNVRGRVAPSSKTSIDRRQASSCVSLISPKYSMCRCTTRPPATRVFSTTLQ